MRRGTPTAYQRGEYDHVVIAVDGDSLTLTRERGSVAVRTLKWTREGPVSEVFIDGKSVPFAQEGATVTLALPALDDTMTVELR